MSDDAHDPDELLDGALARARDAIAAPPAPLDEITRRRLVTQALATSAPPRSATRPSRWPALLAAAAAVAVVALGAWAVLSSGSPRDSGSAGKAASAVTTALPSPSALGEVSDPHTLLAKVRAALPERPSTPPTSSPAVAGGRCAASVETPGGVRAQTFATATYRGAPAVVFVARDRGETLIYVLDRSSCRLLTSQFFHG